MFLHTKFGPLCGLPNILSGQAEDRKKLLQGKDLFFYEFHKVFKLRFLKKLPCFLQWSKASFALGPSSPDMGKLLFLRVINYNDNYFYPNVIELLSHFLFSYNYQLLF